jgi:hypothetical protein
MKSERLNDLFFGMAIKWALTHVSFLGQRWIVCGTDVLHTAAFIQAHSTHRYRRSFGKKRYGVDKSPLGAFKATRQITQVPHGRGSIESVQGR